MKNKIKVLTYFFMFAFFSLSALPQKTDIGENPDTVFIELVNNIYTVTGNGKISKSKWESEVINKSILQKETSTLKFESNNIKFPDNSSNFFRTNIFTYTNPKGTGTKIKLDIPNNMDTSNVTNMAGMFYGVLVDIPDLSNWDTSNVTDMGAMFSYTLKANPDVSKWKTSNVTNMASMFYNAAAAKLRKNDGASMTKSWDVRKVVSMQSMFSSDGNSEFKVVSDPEIGTWNADSLENASYMFAKNNEATLKNSAGFKTPNLVNMANMFFDTEKANPETTNWDVSQVKNMAGVFYATKNANPDVSNWKTGKVTNMDSMFRDAEKATLRKTDSTSMTIAKADGTWNVGRVKTMHLMFYNKSVSDPEIGTWNAERLEDASSMFQGNKHATLKNSAGFKSPYLENANSMFNNATMAEPETADWTTGNVRNMQSMFDGAKIANPDVSKWDTHNVKTMHRMFFGTEKATLRKADGKSMTTGWNVSNVTDMSLMFYDAKVADPEIGTWNALSLEKANSMFQNAPKAKLENSAGFRSPNLKNANSMFLNAVMANPDTTDWTMGNVEDMASMFDGAKNANPNVSKWDTHNVKTMHRMFLGTEKATLRKADGKSMTTDWNVSNVVDMSLMFYNAKVADPEIGTWNASSLEKANSMFQDAPKAKLENSAGFKSPNLKTTNSMFLNAVMANPNTTNWTMGNVTDMGRMFYNAKVANPDVSKWDTSNVTNMDSMFLYAKAANPDTRNWNLRKVTSVGNIFYEIKGNNMDLTAFRQQNSNSLGSSNFKFIAEKIDKLVIPGHFFGIPGYDANKLPNNENTYNGTLTFKGDTDTSTHKYRIIKVNKLNVTKNTNNDCSDSATNKCEVITNLAIFGEYGTKNISNDSINKQFTTIDLQTGLPNAFDADANYIIEPHISAKPASPNTPVEVFQYSQITTLENGKRTKILKDKFLDKVIANWNDIKAEKPGTVVELLTQSLVYPTDSLEDKKLQIKVIYPAEQGVEGRVEEIINVDLKIKPIFDNNGNTGNYLDIELDTNSDGKFSNNTSTYVAKTYIGDANDETEGTKFKQILSKLEKENISINENTDRKFLFWSDKNGEIISQETLFNYKLANKLKENNKIILKANYLKVDINTLANKVEGVDFNEVALVLNNQNPKIINELIGIQNTGILISETADKKINYDGLDKTKVMLDSNGSLIGKAIVTNWENDEQLEKTINIMVRVKAKNYPNEYIDKVITFKVERNEDNKFGDLTPDKLEVVTGTAKLSLQVINLGDNNGFPKEFVLDLDGLGVKGRTNANKIVLKDNSDTKLTIQKDRNNKWTIENPETVLYSIKVENNGNIIITPKDIDTITNKLNNKSIVAVITNRYNPNDTGVTTNSVNYDSTINMAKLEHNYKVNDKAKDIDRNILISNLDSDIVEILINIGNEKLVFDKVGNNYTLNASKSDAKATYTLELDNGKLKLNLPAENTEKEEFKALNGKKISVIVKDKTNEALKSNELTLKTISDEEKDSTVFDEVNIEGYIGEKFDLLEELKKILDTKPYIVSAKIENKVDADRIVENEEFATYNTKGAKTETAIIKYLDDSMRKIKINIKIYDKKYIGSKLDIIKGNDQGKEYSYKDIYDNDKDKKVVGIIEGNKIADIEYDPSFATKNHSN
ncbi:BspA family leucine-rich repeat surface protein [Oceanivirga salmonicida]|uniref:BspA family leucine-rich repeat surface protein n=1 Tax=Oceanivirga salmonicida TaxID=1769291 RepID=UPI0012E1EBE5|nr:BspA family leucine-rich repeat surface protein [Oceanivirga salmonicida]